MYIILSIALLFFTTTIITLYMYYYIELSCESKLKTKDVRMRVEPIPTIDIQFDKSNFPSVVYNDVFSSNNIWQGGYSLDQNKNISSNQTGLVAPQINIQGYVPGG